jgi:hypothetical protein
MLIVLSGSYLRHVCPHWTKSDIWRFFGIMSNLQFRSNLTRIIGTLDEDVCTFMALSRCIRYRMRNVSDKFLGKFRSHVLCSITPLPPPPLPFRKSYRLWDNVGKHGRARLATDDNVLLGTKKMCICMPGNWGEYGCVRNVQYLFLFCGENDNANAPQCYVVRTLPVLLKIMLWFRLRIPSLFLQRRICAEHENFFETTMTWMLWSTFFCYCDDEIYTPIKTYRFVSGIVCTRKKTNYVASQDWKGSFPCFGTNFWHACLILSSLQSKTATVYQQLFENFFCPHSSYLFGVISQIVLISLRSVTKVAFITHAQCVCAFCMLRMDLV